MGYGFREVIVDQPFSGKWTEVDMNLGGGHGTFQGSKFSDSAGGFSYNKSKKQPKPVVENRFLFWRILNDVLELTEASMDFNLEDNQLRIHFPDSPIVGPISVVETDSTLVILVSTVTSVNRFVFMHPSKLEDTKSLNSNLLPSIFQQASQRPIMKFSSFSLFENTINLPVPTTTTSCILPQDNGYIFAMSYENGGVTICKVTKDDKIVCYDMRQSNIFAKILSYTPSILRPTNTATSAEAVVGLYFFCAKVVHERNMELFLVTFSMNGRLRLYMCGNLQTIDSWTLLYDVVVDKRFGVAGFTDSTMQLRAYRNQPKDYPTFTVFIPGHGFKVYQCLRDSRGPHPPKLILNQVHHIGFREKSLIDFCFTSNFLFPLVNNPDEDTDWAVKSIDLTMQHMPRFNLALLEPPPLSEVIAEAMEADPKEFYTDLIFNKSSFSVSTIYSALSMFKNSTGFPKPENDWELTKLYAMRVIDSEIRAVASESDEPVADDEFRELNLKYWGEFYTSCVEYHVNTVKPFGVFYEENTNLLCIVKKSRISFLRPTDFLETAFYFPHLISPKNSVIENGETSNFLKYLEILEVLQSALDQHHNTRIAKRIFQEKKNGMDVWSEVATLLIDTDPHAEIPERPHFVAMLQAKMRDLGANGTKTLKSMIKMMSSWDLVQNVEDAQGAEMDTDQPASMGVSQHFMGSKLGANVAYHILKQLLNMRYIIARNMLLFQSILYNFFSQPESDSFKLTVSYNDQKTSTSTVFRAFSLLSLCDKPSEFVLENWTENSRKVAALLNCPSTDQLIHGKIPDFWPIKLLEFFSYSSSGGLAIRSRVNLFQEPTSVVAYAEAIGNALWTTQDTTDRPFEEFLISAGQYSALADYADYLKYHRRSGIEKAALTTFYKGVSDLFLRNPHTAMTRFMSVTPIQLENVPYIFKLLGIQGKHEKLPNAYYEKAISLFQVFGYLYGVQRLAQKALLICRDDRSCRIMSVLGFKNALALGDYDSAFGFILGMPKESVGPNGQILSGKEREASLRTFVIRVLEKKDITVLVELGVEDYMDSTRSEIEKVLHAQSKLADPMAPDNIYQMVYFYYLARSDFEKAATVLLERIIEIGFKGKGRAALEIQRDCYLDILTCITLKNGEEDDLKEQLGGGSGDGVEVEHWLKTLLSVKLPEETGLSAEEATLRENSKKYEKMYKECELCISLLLLDDDREISPIQTECLREKAKICVEQLVQVHHYDQAVKLATLWDISYLSIISDLAQTCAKLLYHLPTDAPEFDYVKHLDTSELPNANHSASDVAFLVLKKYVTTLEKGKETKLHKEATLVLLQYHVSLPRWLLDSYKKRDVNQLILCFMLYGDWEEAVELSIAVMDVGLGRRDGKEYDYTIQTITPFVQSPIIPYTTIEDLANQIHARLDENPKLEPVLQDLREKCEDFVTRVLETRIDRRLMFAQ